MPYQIEKLRNSNKYRVINKKTGKVHAYGTTHENAVKQVRFLEMLEHGGKSRKKPTKMSNDDLERKVINKMRYHEIENKLKKKM